MIRIFTDRGTEFCGNPEHPAYQLYLAVENIDHTRTKAYSLKPMVYEKDSTKSCRKILSYFIQKKTLYDSLRVTKNVGNIRRISDKDTKQSFAV